MLILAIRLVLWSNPSSSNDHTRTSGELSTQGGQRDITMIINDAQPAVSNAEIVKFIDLWQKHENVKVSEVHFEKEMKLPHDIITPGTSGVPIADIRRRLINAVREIQAK